jgi:hypothetical protein
MQLLADDELLYPMPIRIILYEFANYLMQIVVNFQRHKATFYR